MADDGLQTFLARAMDHRLLTPEEERKLGRIAWAVFSKDDKHACSSCDACQARHEIVLCNIRLVVSVARYYRNRGLAFEDLVQNGIIGLNRAATLYDPERGIRFSTYATLWIKQAIQRGISGGASTIRVPSNVAGHRARVRSAMVQGIEVEGLTEAEVARALSAAEVVTSLDREMVTDEHTHTLLESLTDHHAEQPDDIHDDQVADLHYALSQLEEAMPGRGDDCRRVIEMQFGLTSGEPMHVKEIAAALGKSENTIKTLRREGLEKLQELMLHS